MTASSIQVRLFARARELAGSDTISVNAVDEMTVAWLRTAIAEQYPVLKSLSGQLLIAVDNAYAGEEQPLNAEQEIACFPPVSGG
ncbi:Molybdopterin synthase sulfur carrier subunit [Gimesia panareensis]|uniref:Molybdopterin synthase sulfur carrier subunit n=1 Tax=Gimesia panareensis TaxID=2527978 RepID=A0A518FX25_9PLAN|nr:MoaD/ThiS family protein [Gimesia panareensis]QDV20943.1 Molybdopterin synthase sulfur carrier subunit [Gimesia panareensis]